jgi:hypothetical protein
MVALTQVGKPPLTPAIATKKMLSGSRGYGTNLFNAGHKTPNPSISVKKALAGSRGYGTNLPNRARQFVQVKPFYWS